MLKPVESQATNPTQIHVVLNWFEELRQRVPVNQKLGKSISLRSPPLSMNQVHSNSYLAICGWVTF